MKAARVVLGTNVFIDSDAPIALDDNPLVAFDIENGRLLATLRVPRPPASASVHVERNEAHARDITVQATDRNVTISLAGADLLAADLAEDGTVQVSLFDLRSVGLAIFAEPGRSLHIGGSVLSSNSFVGARFGVQLRIGSH